MIKASVIVAAGVLGLVTAAGATDQAADKDKAAKGPVTCDQIVEAYKHNKSVDETAGMYLVNQSRVAECLKAAGVTDPDENDQ